MVARWGLSALRPGAGPDILIIGTDPILSVVTAGFWKFIRPRTKVAHWCFDLYPEAAFADGLLDAASLPARLIHSVLKHAYSACDLIVDIGPCMRKLLHCYGFSGQKATLVPWALEEPSAVLPPAETERAAIFGRAKLALMYSGSFGRAHESVGILELARALRNDDVQFAFSVRGNREKQLRDSVGDDDTNICFVPFAPPDKLQDRLAAADLHIVSLRQEWTGTVVPSKFFGALAIGRPVIFFGSPESAVAVWIRQHRIGWVWEPGNTAQLAVHLRKLADNPDQMAALRERCHRVYNEHFAQHTVIDGWNAALRNLLPKAQHCSREPLQPTAVELAPGITAP